MIPRAAVARLGKESRIGWQLINIYSVCPAANQDWSCSSPTALIENPAESDNLGHSRIVPKQLVDHAADLSLCFQLVIEIDLPGESLMLHVIC